MNNFIKDQNINPTIESRKRYIESNTTAKNILTEIGATRKRSKADDKPHVRNVSLSHIRLFLETFQ